MGNIIDTFPCKLTPSDIERLKASTVFNAVEIRAIWYYYNFLSRREEMITKRLEHSLLCRSAMWCDMVLCIERFSVEIPSTVSCDVDNRY